MAKDTLAAINSYAHTADCYENFNNIDSQIFISEKSAALYQKCMDKKKNVQI
jgi:hypothetical protein